MAEISIPETLIKEPVFIGRIDNFILENGSKRIVPYAKTSPELKEKVARLLEGLLGFDSIRRYFQNSHGDLQIGLKKDGERIFLLLGDEKVDLEGNEAHDIFQSLIACDDASPIESDQEMVDRVVKEKLEKMRDDLQNGSNLAKIAELTAVVSDLLSICRNSSSVVTPAAISIMAMGITGGALSTLSGTIMLVNAAIDAHGSSKIGDTEGMAMAGLFGATGVSLAALSAGMVVNKAASLQGAAGAAGAAGMYVVNPFSIAMNVFFLGYSSYQMHNATTFRSDLNESVELGGAKGGIDFLHDQLYLNETDEKELQLIKDPEQQNAERVRRLDCKWARFERRTDKETLQAILPKVGVIKKAFDEGSADVKTVEDAKDLLQTVLHANYKEIIKTTILILASLIGVAATFVGMTMSGGAPLILFALLGALWLFVDKSGITDYIAEGCWSLHLKLLDGLDTSLLPSIDQLLANPAVQFETQKELNEYLKTEMPELLKLSEQIAAPFSEFLEKYKDGGALTPKTEQLSDLQAIYRNVLAVQKANQFVYEKPIQEMLDDEIQDVEEIELGGTKMQLFRQLALDYQRHPKIIIDNGEELHSYESAQTGNSEGEAILLDLKKMAGDDEELFSYLAAFQTQTSRNYAIQFVMSLDFDMERYTPNFKNGELVTFRKNQDGSFEVEIRRKIDMINNEDSEDTDTLCSYSALYRLEQVDGVWNCQQPVYHT